MGYSGVNIPVKKISDGKVYKTFEAREVYCDPCALPGSRYRITYPSGCIETLAFWQLIILPWDDARTRYLKWAINCEVTRINAQSAESTHAAWQANKFGNVPNLQLAGKRGR